MSALGLKYTANDLTLSLPNEGMVTHAFTLDLVRFFNPSLHRSRDTLVGFLTVLNAEWLSIDKHALACYSASSISRAWNNVKVSNLLHLKGNQDGP